ncbi:hypothetical protein HZ326_26013 [Fusarium oxysporum f. sp. albedinis]|nr:hypothetical protein HZ326_26013 [Fusarium oxysporum f. sp. albedinis]
MSSSTSLALAPTTAHEADCAYSVPAGQMQGVREYVEHMSVAMALTARQMLNRMVTAFIVRRGNNKNGCDGSRGASRVVAGTGWVDHKGCVVNYRPRCPLPRVSGSS